MEIIARVGFVVALLFVAVIASTVIGGIVGWVVGLVFPFVPQTINQLVGTELTAFELGAVLGFVGAFFRNSSTSK
jgi:hypothetical protein